MQWHRVHASDSSARHGKDSPIHVHQYVSYLNPDIAGKEAALCTRLSLTDASRKCSRWEHGSAYRRKPHIHLPHALTQSQFSDRLRRVGWHGWCSAEQSLFPVAHVSREHCLHRVAGCFSLPIAPSLTGAEGCLDVAGSFLGRTSHPHHH